MKPEKNKDFQTLRLFMVLAGLTLLLGSILKLVLLDPTTAAQPSGVEWLLQVLGSR